MIESFPFIPPGQSLVIEDFHQYRVGFIQAVLSRIPTAESVLFASQSSVFTQLYADRKISQQAARLFSRMSQGKAAVAGFIDSLLFAFQTAEGATIVAVASGVDPLLVKRASEDWLLEEREAIRDKFVLTKKAYQDTETGLLNTAHLFGMLSTAAADEKLSLCLIEIPPGRKGRRDVFRNAQKAAAAIKNSIDSSQMLHHLGQCVFALLGRHKNGSSPDAFNAHLVYFLKREGFFRVHIGSTKSGLSVSADSTTTSQESLLDEAWTALMAATRRGPFSFCDFSQLIQKDTHPLAPPEPNILRKIRRLNKNDRSFAIVKLSMTVTNDHLSQLTDKAKLPAKACLLQSVGSSYLYLPNYTGDRCLQYVKYLVTALQNLSDLSEIYAGISLFPYHDFRLSEAIRNSQKAMLHAEFFGAGAVVLFDALSLNVSGDIYFNDGDLPKAVHEYARGLEIEPEDINLLNSLGVTYALLNKRKPARQTFEKVLSIEPQNYMALYNLGLGAQQAGDWHEALEWFGKALRHCDDGQEATEVKKDLQMQMGQLYCRTGKYDNAIRFLGEWQRGVGTRQQGRVAKYLGEAYLGSGDGTKAMTWLQRALNYNGADHEALSLLGVAILREDEGTDIALSLCSKSIELAPEEPLMHQRLAEVLVATGNYDTALEHLQKCRGNTIDPLEVNLLRAMAYGHQGKDNRANYWLSKVMAAEHIQEHTQSRARQLSIKLKPKER